MTPEQASATARILFRQGQTAKDAYRKWVAHQGTLKADLARARLEAYAKAPAGTADFRKTWVEAEIADMAGALVVADGMVRGELEAVKDNGRDKSVFQSLLANQREETRALGAGQDWQFDDLYEPPPVPPEDDGS